MTNKEKAQNILRRKRNSRIIELLEAEEKYKRIDNLRVLQYDKYIGATLVIDVRTPNKVKDKMLLEIIKITKDQYGEVAGLLISTWPFIEISIKSFDLTFIENTSALFNENKYKIPQIWGEVHLPELNDFSKMGKNDDRRLSGGTFKTIGKDGKFYEPYRPATAEEIKEYYPEYFVRQQNRKKMSDERNIELSIREQQAWEDYLSQQPPTTF